MKRFIAYLYLFALCLTANALNGFFYSADRLSCSSVNAIVQDSYGLLWIGSEHGLDSFDGYTFTPHAPLCSDDVHPASVASLYCDAGGRLWVGTARGLLLYDRAGDTFRPVTFPDGLSPRVAQMVELRDGRLVAGTAGYGLFAVDADSLVATRVTSLSTRDDNSYFNHLFLSSDGTFWKSGADERVVRCKAGAEPQTFTTGYGSVVSFVERNGQTLACCPHGLIDANGRKQHDDIDAEGLHFNAAVADAQGNIYIGTRSGGLHWLPQGSERLQRLPVVAHGADITGATINVVYLDRQGNLWVGCELQGLLMLPLVKRPLFQTWGSETSLLMASSVTDIVEGYGGSVFCAVPGRGVYGFSADGLLYSHPPSPQDAETLYRDADANYWLGTASSLYRINPEAYTYEALCTLPGDHVNVMTDAGNGLLAVSTFGAGLAIVDKASGRVVRQLTMHDTDTIGRGRLVNDWIYALDTDNKGRLWIGTASGVSCYDIGADRFLPYANDAEIGREACTALRALASGDVLLGLECGLYRWSPAKGLRAEAGTEALRGRSVSFIAEDERHELWLSTNDGIWHWTPASATLAAYVGAGGMCTREFVRGAGLLATDGRIFLGTADGITLFHPDSLRHHRQANAEVHLTAFTVGDKRVSVMPTPDRFTLSYLDASFRMEFSLLTFDDVADISFDYRFRGEERWQTTGRGHNTISFSHLPPDEYVLEVRARQADATTAVQRYTIVVRPPWWRSTWAYLVYVLLLCALTAFGVVAYKRHLQNRYNSEKLQLLLSTINADDTPLTLDDLKRAIHTFVQSRKHKRGVYGDTETMADRVEVPDQRGNDEALMERIMQSISRHLGDSDFSVEQLCAEAAISRAHLHRKMKEMTGLSVTEFIRNIRLEQAARLLRERKLNVTQVAYTVGFSSLGYFTTVFRKHFGVTPREFMNGGSEGTEESDNS